MRIKRSLYCQRIWRLLQGRHESGEVEIMQLFKVVSSDIIAPCQIPPSDSHDKFTNGMCMLWIELRISLFGIYNKRDGSPFSQPGLPLKCIALTVQFTLQSPIEKAKKCYYLDKIRAKLPLFFLVESILYTARGGRLYHTKEVKKIVFNILNFG